MSRNVAYFCAHSLNCLLYSLLWGSRGKSDLEVRKNEIEKLIIKPHVSARIACNGLVMQLDELV
jgi:hypothetical protein